MRRRNRRFKTMKYVLGRPSRARGKGHWPCRGKGNQYISSESSTKRRNARAPPDSESAGRRRAGGRRQPIGVETIVVNLIVSPGLSLLVALAFGGCAAAVLLCHCHEETFSPLASLLCRVEGVFVCVCVCTRELAGKAGWIGYRAGPPR